MKLDNQVAVVTGAGRGIGEAIARRCAAEGARVALVARTLCQIEAVRQDIAAMGGTAIAIQADVTDPQAMQIAAHRVEEELGVPDLLVPNAGRHLCIGPVWESDAGEWWADVQVNVLGTFLCCQAMMPGMVARGSGRIVTMIGGGTDKPLPYASAYAVAKTAVQRFTETLAVEVAEYGIRVFSLRPGFVRTAMSEFHAQDERSLRWFPHVKRRLERGENVPPERAADLVVELASGRFDEMSGRAFRVVDDIDVIEEKKPRIIEDDLYTLRMGYV